MTKVKEPSIAELEALLAEKKKEQKQKEERERTEYVKSRDALIVHLSNQALQFSATLKKFSDTSHDALKQQRVKLDEYGAIRKNSKGGFHIMTEDGQFKIVYSYSAIGDYDERADKAEELLKEFLSDMVKKKEKDKGPYRIILSLLEKNKAGKLEYARIQTLYKYENDYDDPRWKESIKLFKEAFVVKDSKMQPMFYQRTEKGTYELIKLNFSGM